MSGRTKAKRREKDEKYRNGMDGRTFNENVLHTSPRAVWWRCGLRLDLGRWLCTTSTLSW